MFNFYKPKSRWLRRISAASLFVLVGSVWSHAATFYSRPSATNFADVASWSSNTNGIGGTNPASISNADDFIIQNGSNMVLNASAAVRTLTMNAGRLTISSNTLTISLPTGNNSTLNIASGGIFTLNGGSVVLNGNMILALGGAFHQGGGTFTVDGNDNNNPATSVVTGTRIVSWTINSALRLGLTGGTFTIVDPHVGTALGTDWAFIFNSGANLSTAATTGHTFQIGNGVSTQATANTGGFIIEGYEGSSRFMFGNLVINTSTAAGNRHVSNGTSFAGQTIGVLGNLTINSGSEYRAYSYGTANAPNSIAVGGDLTNNGTLIMPGTLVLGASSGTSTTQPSNIAQNIGGTGTFQNGHPTFTAAFQPIDANYVGLTVNNASAGGVTFASKAINNGGYPGTVRGTLTLTRGLIDASAAPFILGSSVTANGTLSYAAGGFRSGTTFSRWYSNLAGGATFTASSDLTSAPGRYPFAENNLDKSFFVRQNTAPTTGGTISVTFTNANTQSAAAITDGAYTIDYRHDANWTVTSSGITGAATYFLGARLPGAFASSNGNVRLCLAAAAAPGVHQAGTNNPTAQRITIPFASLAGTYYMGVANADQPFVSVANGNYNVGGTWNKGTVPTNTDPVTIGAGTTVVIDDARTNAGTVVAQGGTLNLNAGGALTVAGTGANLVVSGTFNGNAGTASIGSLPGTGVTLNAGGTFNVAGATINLGPQDNTFCSRFFTQNGGTLNVSAGNLNIAGRYVSAAALNPKFIQSGGAIRIDGNAGGVATNSIGSGLAIFDLQVGSNSDVQLTGGTLTIVDPHANATASNTFIYTCTEPGIANTTTGHSFFFGDGTSSDAGGNATARFRVVPRGNNGFFKFCNLVVRPGPGTNREVVTGTSGATGIGVYQNLQVNVGSTWNSGSAQNLITGNFVVNGTAIFTGTFQNSGVQFPSLAFETTNIPTSIGGTGTIQNLASAPTAMLTGIYFDNTGGLTLNRPVTMSGAFSLVNGVITTTASNVLTHNIGTSNNVFVGPNTAGYINGPFQRQIPVGLVFNVNFLTFPVGKTGLQWMTLNVNTTGAAGATLLEVEAFDSNTGSFGSGMTSLDANRRWATTILGPNNLVQYGWTAFDNNMVSGNALAHSATANGVYDAFGGSALFAAATAILPASLSSGVTEPGANFRAHVGFGQTGPLSVNNVLATQQTGATNPGSTNVNVMRYGIVVGGATGGITLTDLDWEYTGSNPLDISAVTLWTGTITAPVTQVQSVGLSGVNATFTGLSIPMSAGNNFLWIRVNLAPGATIGNVVDGQLPQGNITFSTSGGAVDNSPQPAATLNPTGNILIDYCTPTYTSGCSGGADGISNVTLGSLNNASGCAANPYYTFFNAVTKPSLTLGNAYTVNVTMGSDGTQYAAVWIDFNQNGTFEATEYFTTGTNAGANGTSAIAITVPGGATLGDTRMRVRGGEDFAFTGFGQACGASSSGFGETEDYIVTIVSPAPRSIDPIVVVQQTGGMQINSTNNNLLRVEIPVAGSTGSHTLTSLRMTYTGTTAADIATNGVSLWTGTSSAPLTQIGTSVSISGGTANFTGLSAALDPGSNFFWVRVNTSATAVLGNIVDGSIVTGDITINNVAPAVAAGTQPPVDLNPVGSRFIDYCPVTYAFNNAVDIITNVSLNGVTPANNLSNTTAANPPPSNYFFYNAVNRPDLFQGSTYNLSLTFGTDGTQWAGVWIDFNINGVFEASEYFAPAGVTGSSGTVVIPIAVPVGATLGDTRMRIRGGEDGALNSGQACGASTSGYGECEDYIVTITAPPNCSSVGSWPATNITASATTVCSGSVVNFGITVPMPSATGITYQWRRNGSNLGAATTAATNSIAVTLGGTYDVVVRCNGTPVVTSGSVVLTVNSPTISGSTPASTCGPGSVTISATGTGTSIRWYNAPTGGTLLATGGSYVTPIISATTPYYASAVNLFGTESGGRPALVTAGGTLLTNYGIQFTANADMILNNVTAYPTGTGDFIVALYNSSGVEIATSPAIPVVGGAGGPQVVNLNFDIAAGSNYRLLLKSSTGLTQFEREFVGGFPYNSASNDLSVTAGWNGAATTGAYYYFYNLSISRVCASTPRTLVNATYTPPPALFVNASPSSICLGSTSTGTAFGAGYTTYTWTGGPFTPAGPGATKTLSPSTTTTYSVTATTGGGCVNSGSVTVVVNPTPTTPVINTVTPAGALCIGASKTFSASSTPGGTVSVFNEGFNTAPSLGAWTLQKGGSISNGSPLPDWTVQLTPLSYLTQITNFSVSTPASGFAYINSDALGSGTYTSTFGSMASPAFSTVGYTNLSLSFRHVYRASSAAGSGSVQYSTNGGATWSTNVYSTGSTTTPAQAPWNGANIQTVVTTVTLPPVCDNQPDLRVRFRYEYGWDYYWMIDNVDVQGTPEVQYQWSSNFAFAGIPLAAQSFDDLNGNMTATPTQGGSMTYTVTARNANGCTAPITATHSTTVSDIVISPTNTSPQRENTNLVISTSATGGFGGYSYQWRKLPSPTVINSSASFNFNPSFAANSGDYQVTVTDGQGCSVVGTTEALVYAALVWNGSVSNSWTNPLNWTPNIVPANDCAENVAIPQSANPPVFPGPAQNVGNFVVETGGAITLNSNLNVCGALGGGAAASTSVSGTGTISLTGTGTQIVGGILDVDRLIINKPSGQVNFNGTTIIRDLLTISNSSAVINVNASGNVILRSTATGTGKIGPVPAGTTVNVNAPGKFTMERHIPVGAGTGAWHLIGSPITGKVFNDWADDFTVTGPSTGFGTQGGGIWSSGLETERSTIFKYRENVHNVYVDTVQKRGWLVPAAADNLNNGEGYRVWINYFGAQSAFDNQGLFHIGNKTFPALTRSTPANCQYGFTPSTNEPCTEGWRGWNLLANPYPCPIDWDNNAAWTKPSAMNNAFYTWNAAAGTYQAYLGTTGTPGVSLGGSSPASANANPSVIPSSQAFFVKVTSGTGGTISVTESAKITTNNGQFVRTAVTGEQVRIRMTKDAISDYRYDGMVRFNESATYGFDQNMDLDALSGDNFDFYLVGQNEEALLLNTVPVPTESKVIPVRTNYAGYTGAFRFSFLEISSMTNGVTIYLKDNFLGTLTNVNDLPVYAFDVNNTDGSNSNDRFELVLVPSSVTGTAKLVNASGFGVYPNPSSGNGKVTLAVKGTHTGTASVVVVDMVGKEVFSSTMEVEAGEVSEKTVELGLASGVYTVKVSSGTKTYTDKLVVR